MRLPVSLAVMLLCSAGLNAQSVPGQVPATPAQAMDPASDDAPFSPWRTVLDTDQATLGEVRGLFLNQDVVVGGTVEDLGPSSQYLEWRIATASSAAAQAAGAAAQKAPQQTRYAIVNAIDGLPIRYSSNTGTVVAVQLHDPLDSGAKINALGVAITDDDAVNPYFDLVVKFDDGTIALTSQYPVTLATTNVVELTSVLKAGAERIKAELPAVIGRFVFAAGFTQLYRSDSTLDEMTRQDDQKRISPADIPLFEPLEIMGARYAEPAGVVIEVQLPNGDRALSLTTRAQLYAAPVKGEDPSFLDRVIGLLLADIPSDLNKREVAAIKTGSIYRGMRAGALDYVMGFPDKESKWGDGGKQLTFRKSLVVYVSSMGTVADWKFVDGR